MRLNLRHRLQLIKAAIGLFGNDTGKVYGMLAAIFPGKTGIPPARGVADFLKAYSTSPWLRAVVSKTADAVSAANWQVLAVRKPGGKAKLVKALQDCGYVNRKRILKSLRRAGELEVIEKHPALDFIHGGNDQMSGRAVRKLLSIDRDLVGEWFVIKERNIFGAPVGNWPMPPHWIASTPTPQHRFYRVSWAGWQGEIPDTEILWFRDHDPYNPYGRGTGMAYALTDELETDEFAAKHLKSFFWNRARPDFVVMPAGDEEWGNVEELQRKWVQEHQGFWRVFKPHFFQRRAEIKEIGQNFEQMQMVPLRQWERDATMQVYGVSPEVFGVIENSNRATIDAADYMVARYVAVPRLEEMRDFLQKFLAPDYDERMILDYESPVQEDKEFYLKVAQALPSSRNVDEWRELGGLEELEGGKGKIYPVNQSTFFVRDLEEKMELEPMGEEPPSPPGEEEPEEKPEEEEEG